MTNMRITTVVVGLASLAFLMIASTCGAGMYTINIACNDADFGYWALQENPEDAPISTQVIGSQTGYRVGFGGSPARGTVLFWPFELPVLAEDEFIDSAQLSFLFTEKNSSPSFNLDLWGTGFQGNTGTSTMSKYFQYDTGDPNSDTVKIEDNIITPTTATGTITSSTNEALTAYLQGFYDANPDYAGGSYAYFRLNMDGGYTTGAIGYRIQSPEAVNLTLTIVPEPSTIGLLAMAGSALLLFRRRRRRI